MPDIKFTKVKEITAYTSTNGYISENFSEIKLEQVKEDFIYWYGEYADSCDFPCLEVEGLFDLLNSQRDVFTKILKILNSL